MSAILLDEITIVIGGISHILSLSPAFDALYNPLRPLERCNRLVQFHTVHIPFA